MRMAGRMWGSSTVDADELESDSNMTADADPNLTTRMMPTPDSGFAPTLGKQASVPPADLGTRFLRSGRQIGWETDLKKVSHLSTRMSANNHGKRNLAAMEEDDELYHSADSPEPQKKTARQLLAIDTGIEV